MNKMKQLLMERELAEMPRSDRLDEGAIVMRKAVVKNIMALAGTTACLHEVLFTAVRLFDQFLSREQPALSEFGLIGVTALDLACKFHEEDPLTAKDWEVENERRHSCEDIKAMEVEFLRAIDYNMRTPTLFDFLSDAESRDRNLLHFAKLSLLGFGMTRFHPSLVADACRHIARSKKANNAELQSCITALLFSSHQ